MNCEQARDQDMVEKYVAGQLPNEDMTAFEEHYFGCDLCLEAVQLGQAIHFGAEKQVVEAPKVIQMPVRSHARPRWMYPAAAAAAIVVVALIGWRAFVGQTPKPEVAHGGPAPVQNPAQAGPATKAPISEPQLMASNA